MEKKKKKTFKFFTLEQRKQIEQLLHEGYTGYRISKLLNMNESSVYRELQVNSIDGVYNAVEADKLAKSRDRWEQARRKQQEDV